MQRMQILQHKRHALLLLSLALISVDIFLVAPGAWSLVNLLQPHVVAEHHDLLTAAFLLLRFAILYGAEFSFAYLVLYARRGIAWREIGIRWPADRTSAFLLLLLSLVAILAILLVAALWSHFYLLLFHVPTARDDQFTLYSGPLSHAALGVHLLFAAPICEEIIFRGLIQGWLLRRGIVPWMAIIGTALLFAAGHLDPSNLESYFLSGLVLGCLAYRTRSLLPGMLWHGIFNLLALLALLAH
jgi:membrane protease YdiL (CAAX protease family)